MKTWDDLDVDQQKFVRTYLKTSFKDLFRKREKTETNRAIIGAYGNYIDLKELFDRRAAQVPDDYPQRVPVMALAATADAQHVDGKFDQAAETIARAIPQIAQLQINLTDAADILRGGVAPAGEDGFAQSDKDRVNAAREAVLQHLGDPLPTYAQITAARAAGSAFLLAVEQATAAMDDVPAANAALQQAVARSSVVLTASADLDISPYATTPQAPGINAVIQKAKELQAAIQNVPTDDATALRALAAQLIEFSDTDAATALVADAVQSLVDDITAYYDVVRPALETARDADLTRFDAEDEHGAMTTLQTEVTDDIAHIATIIGNRDPDEMRALRTRIDEAAERAGQLDTLQRTVGIRLTKAELGTKGAKAAHQDGIMRLMDTNKDAADKVIASLERNAVLLGGQPATPDFIRTKQTETKTLADELEAARLEWIDARDAEKLRAEELSTLDQAYDILEAEIQAMDQPIPIEKLDALTQAGEAFNTKLAEQQAAEQLMNAKATEWQAKNTAHERSEKVLEAAQTQRTLLDAISFGPLSPVAGRPIPADMVADVVELFDKNPALATQTCTLAATAKDPKSLAETALFLAGQCENGFEWQPPAGEDGVVPAAQAWNDEYAATYARDLLSRAAYFGPEFSADAQAAIAAGIHRKHNDILRAAGTVTPKETASLRATEAADAMMKTETDEDGKTTVKLDIAGDAFKEVLARQKFSGDGQFQPSAMMNAEMDKLADFFGDADKGEERREKAEEILNSVTAVPDSPAARDLMHKSLGIPLADFDDPAKADEVKAKIQQGILKSMVTPVAQASVGSCFATAPLRKMRDEDPLAVMEMYRDIATTGTFKPKQGRPIPAVTNIPDGDDPLTRSLEYSVAAASARLASSRERKDINVTMFGLGDPTAPSLGNVGTVLDADVWTRLQPRLVLAVASGYSFTYDPLAGASGVSSDGSSDKGFMRMVEADTQKPILSQAEFVDFIKRKATEAVAAAGIDDADRDKVLDYIDDPAFIASIDRLAGTSKPWDMSFGGFGDEAGDALFGHGGDKRSTDLVSIDASDSTGDRAIKVLKALSGLSDQGMTMVATSGMHSFNALPPDGAYKKLLEGDVDANIQSMLVAPGQKIATTKLPVDRAVYLYDKQMEAALGYVSEDAEKELIRAEFGASPTTEMTPAELEAHIASKLDAVKAAVADAQATKWATDTTPTPDAGAIAVKTAELKTEQDARFTKIATRTLTQELGVPEFVVADPNWGDEGDHQLFVIAPDPLTGEPKLWQKSVMSGGLWPLGDDWLKANWRVED